MSTSSSVDPSALPGEPGLPDDLVDLPTGQALLGSSVTEPNKYAVPLVTLLGGAVVSQADHVVSVPVSSHEPYAAPMVLGGGNGDGDGD